ncbi:MAG: alpha/beta hydrolase [Streptosporangiaceae bacterium]|nr:alpha/beta hydrolase [Streptosporangiaceae bacterium]MBV9856917.1 alpha/beta hydrolase [Streptosporangiaceae bacterium]
MSIPLPPTFRRTRVRVGEVGINTVTAGHGSPVLLLHGYPQTHLIWHHVAAALAEQYTVVLTDLRGYGDSDKPPGGPDHRAYAKRTMARDQVLVMRELGFGEFAVAGHDRGGRVGHRLALDYPDAVTGLAVLDIVPTRHVFGHADAAFGLGYWHWFFLAAGDGIPERLIGSNPEFWIRTTMNARQRAGLPFDPAAVAEYVRCFASPEAIHASCEDYRAAASIDLADDEESASRGDRVTAPVLTLWGSDSFVGRHYDVLAVWRRYATKVTGQALPCDHYLPEQAPAETSSALLSFLAGLDNSRRSLQFPYGA